MKRLLSRFLTLVSMLSRRIRLLRRRYNMILVTEDTFLESLSSLGISSGKKGETLKCACCGRQLTPESIHAWVILSEGFAFYCGAQECLGAIVEGGKSNGA
jgi:hypothetical protein